MVNVTVITVKFINDCGVGILGNLKFHGVLTVVQAIFQKKAE